MIVVETTQLSKVYPGRTMPALDNVDLSIAGGQIFGLLGPNGAGKTTFLAILCGLIPATRGSVMLHGRDTRAGGAATKRDLGLVPQELALYPSLTARENLGFFGAVNGLRGGLLCRRIDYCLQLGGLETFADQRVETFSGGLKRRLNLVIALLHAPTLLILDEPTVGIDPQSRKLIHDNLRRLRQDGMTIIYTSHYMEEVEQLCDRIAIIDGGRVVAQGSMDELLSVASDTLELRASGAIPASLQQALCASPAIRSVRVDGRTLHLTSTQPSDAARAAMDLLRNNGLDTLSLSFGVMHLEQVFLALTGTRLRD